MKLEEKLKKVITGWGWRRPPSDPGSPPIPTPPGPTPADKKRE